MNIQTLKTAHQAGIEAAKKNAQLFSELHPKDSGSCGGAVVLIAFGRKRKIKQLFIDAEIIKDSDDWDIYGRKHFVIQLDFYGQIAVKNYNQQNVSYKEMALREYKTTLENLVEGLDIFVHTWSD